MNKLLIGLAVSALTTASAISAPDSVVMTPVNQFVDAFNKADSNVMQATSLRDSVVIDDFPPYVWRGVGATSKWFRAFQAFALNHNLSAPKVTLDKPLHSDVVGDDAYIVVPTRFTYQSKGKPVNAAGMMTLTPSGQRQLENQQLGLGRSVNPWNQRQRS